MMKILSSPRPKFWIADAITTTQSCPTNQKQSKTSAKRNYSPKHKYLCAGLQLMRLAAPKHPPVKRRRLSLPPTTKIYPKLIMRRVARLPRTCLYCRDRQTPYATAVFAYPRRATLKAQQRMDRHWPPFPTENSAVLKMEAAIMPLQLFRTQVLQSTRI